MFRLKCSWLVCKGWLCTSGGRKIFFSVLFWEVPVVSS